MHLQDSNIVYTTYHLIQANVKIQMRYETTDTLQSFHHAEKTTDEPLTRVMALHALACCERRYYLEEVEEMEDRTQIADRRWARLCTGITTRPETLYQEIPGRLQS